ncbi:MAG TPA: gephyrin-like molybdotransferase Glp [Acidimicrobiales bacterium]|nr:gephyrin-like molybdotransferase Glp [Acidimicrobiales bacterium]
MIPLEEARAVVLDGCPPLAPRDVPLLAAAGCVTAEAVVADEDVPPFANTAMDGYAVRATDTDGPPVRLRVVGTLAAGSPPRTTPIGPGEAVRIMTGAPMPPGADAVVMVERTRAEEGGASVVIEAAAGPGQHVRGAGEDLRAGQVVCEPGTALSPGHLGVLASVGRETVCVVPRPRVGVLSTGDELVAGAGPLRPGQIRDSNRPTLLALAGASGCEPFDLGLVGDDEEALVAALERGVVACDAIVTSGGVSVGDYDYVKAVLDRLGEMHWWQVAIKPAKPLAFGRIGTTPVFGLPGNPVSSMVSFELFARPALRRMMGHTVLDRPRVPAVADEDLRRRPDGKLHLVRVVAATAEDGRWHVRSSGGQASHLLHAMARANALALVPDGDGVAAGDEVEVMLLRSGDA